MYLIKPKNAETKNLKYCQHYFWPVFLSKSHKLSSKSFMTLTFWIKLHCTRASSQTTTLQFQFSVYSLTIFHGYFSDLVLTTMCFNICCSNMIMKCIQVTAITELFQKYKDRIYSSCRGVTSSLSKPSFMYTGIQLRKRTV